MAVVEGPFRYLIAIDGEGEGGGGGQWYKWGGSIYSPDWTWDYTLTPRVYLYSKRVTVLSTPAETVIDTLDDPSRRYGDLTYKGNYDELYTPLKYKLETFLYQFTTSATASGTSYGKVKYYSLNYTDRINDSDGVIHISEGVLLACTPVELMVYFPEGDGGDTVTIEIASPSYTQEALTLLEAAIPENEGRLLARTRHYRPNYPDPPTITTYPVNNMAAEAQAISDAVEVTTPNLTYDIPLLSGGTHKFKVTVAEPPVVGVHRVETRPEAASDWADLEYTAGRIECEYEHHAVPASLELGFSYVISLPTRASSELTGNMNMGLRVAFNLNQLDPQVLPPGNTSMELESLAGLFPLVDWYTPLLNGLTYTIVTAEPSTYVEVVNGNSRLRSEFQQKMYPTHARCTLTGTTLIVEMLFVFNTGERRWLRTHTANLALKYTLKGAMRRRDPGVYGQQVGREYLIRYLSSGFRYSQDVFELRSQMDGSTKYHASFGFTAPAMRVSASNPFD